MSNLALGKKRRNNLLEEALFILRGEIDAAINASKCQESMFERHGNVPDEIYQKAIVDCDILDKHVISCGNALGIFREETDKNRVKLLEG